MNNDDDTCIREKEKIRYLEDNEENNIIRLHEVHYNNIILPVYKYMKEKKRDVLVFIFFS